MVASSARNITNLSLHNRRPTFYKKYGFEHIPFILLYGVVLYHCYLTAGDPYQQAIADLEAKGIFRHVDGPVIALKPGVDDMASSVLSSAIRQDPISPATDSENAEDDGPEHQLPNPFLPGFWPLVSLATVTCLHVLLMLLQVWSVSVLTKIRYTSAKNVKTASYVKVSPKRHRGKTELVPLVKSAGAAPHFMFQRRKYIYNEDKNVFDKVHMPTNLPLSTYLKHQGIDSAATLDEKRKLYGPNRFDIPTPKFLDLYKQQLVAPLTVFQIFCILLWMLDEYWQYSLFTLFMIVSFEGVTVFSRLRNLKTLRGMGNEVVEINVFRCKKWQTIKSDDLLPGDLISIKRHNEADTIPVDCVLLSGNAVVNEATLTGESVPQMKESLCQGDQGGDMGEEPLLDLKSSHKVHLLFCGTKLMQQDQNTLDEGESLAHTIKTPDGGCLAYVLRTGFNSSQGKLVRMIEFSSEGVNANTMDSLILIAMLLVFAIASSGYVLKKGLENKDRSQFELLLHCVLIVTSVVPPELPMQMALAVNTALMALIKLQIFCTEPFRIPTAGKVDICMYDKTGTLTTDQLTAVGVVGHTKEQVKEKVVKPRTMFEAPLEASIVLGGCHSLVQIDGKLVGDPVEEASLKSLDFTYDAASRCAKPKLHSKKGTRTWPASVDLSRMSIEIIHRHHFKSKLQRMSVVARVNPGAGKARPWALVKGSPEAIEQLLEPSAKPSWYNDTYLAMARDGLRVLALAYKEVDPSMSDAQLAKQPRAWCESNLKFAGFVAFTCLVRKDSKEIISHLHHGSHAVCMITGDSVLTAIHVACDVNIIPRPKSETLILNAKSDSSLEWIRADDDSHVCAYDPKGIRALSTKYSLCVTGPSLGFAGEVSEDIWQALDAIHVYARMTPEAKEKVLTKLNHYGHHTLMCGDGANDVGALKQAHVGIALLSGFGSANVAKAGDDGKDQNSKLRKQSVATADYSKLLPSALRKKLTELGVDHSKCKDKEELVALLEKATEPQKQVAKKPAAAPVVTAEEKKKRLEQKTRELEEEVARLEAEGVSFARFKAMMNFMKREAAEAKKLQEQKRGGGGFEASAQKMAEMYEMEDGEIPMVKLGDASIASPFTSKMPSISSSIDIIRQGRCALVTTIQMYQVLALNCLISSYSLSVLYLDGVKYGDRQMTASGILMTVSFLTLSRAAPLNQLSPVRPLTSIFHPALFLSLLGQFALHLFCMVYAVNLAKQQIPDYVPDLNGKFQPNLINTVVFLISTVQQVSVFVVNYKGQPFMKGMTENPGLLYSLGLCAIGTFLGATEAMPMFNKWLQLVPFPDPALASTIFNMVLLDIVGTLVWDRLMVFIFAPKILQAQLKSITPDAIKKLFKMILMMLAVVYVFTPSEESWKDLQEQGLVGDL